MQRKCWPDTLEETVRHHELPTYPPPAYKLLLLLLLLYAVGHPGHKDTIQCVRVLNLNGITYIITGGDDGLVKIFDSNDDKLLRVKTFDGHNGRGINCLDIVAEHPITGVTVIISGSGDGAVQLWDLNGSLSANNMSIPIQTLPHPKKVNPVLHPPLPPSVYTACSV